MTRIIVKRFINAPVEKVFKSVADISNLPNVVPEVISTEITSETKFGVGTKFRETRMVNDKKSITDLKVTEYTENESVRMVADSHGTIWDSFFTVKKTDAGTELVITMDSKAHKLLPKLLNPLLKNLFKKGLEKHMDAVKNYCEK